MFAGMKAPGISIFLLAVGFSAAAQFNQHARIIVPSSDSLAATSINFTHAQFPGGMAKFYKYLSKKLSYPKDAKKLGIEGKVYVSFVVAKDGSIPYDSVRVIKGLFESCDKEALRVIRASPKWKPGRLTETNEPVAQRIVLPILFKRRATPK